ncbi:MAG TPA: ABC transporter substrate-binding protein [Acidisphaera sp.]|nr:ABC transporter substrate-binding protein [Acidisphaera sp.]
MHITKRDFLRAAAAGAVAVPLARPFVARAAAPTQINLAFFVETKPTMIMKAQHLLEDATKLPVKWQEYGSGAEINAAILAGGADIGLAIGSSPVAAAVSQGIPLQLVGLVDNIGGAEEMTVRKAANIHTPADFKGKKVATPFGSTSHFRLLGFLKTNNLSLSDVHVLDMRPDAIVAAWIRGDIDACYVWSPAKSKCLANGGEVFRTAEALDAEGYVIADCIAARTGFVEAYPEGVVALLRSYGQSLELYRTKPDEAAAIVAKEAGVSAEVAASDMAEYDFVSLAYQIKPVWLGAPGQGGRFDEVLKRTADFLVQQGSIRSAASLDALKKATHTEYLAKAVA